MSRATLFFSCLTSITLAAACSSSSAPTTNVSEDGGPEDAGTDASSADAAPHDAGVDARANDASPGDGSVLDGNAPELDASTADAPSDAQSDAPDATEAGDPYASDPHNCGALGHDCLGASCANDLCAAEVVASTPWNSYDYPANEGYVDANNVYVWEQQAVWGAPKSGGTFVPLTQGIAASEVIFKNGSFYVADVPSDSDPMRVYTLPATSSADAGAPTLLFDAGTASGATYFVNFDVSATNLYGVNICNNVLTMPLAPNATITTGVHGSCTGQGGMDKIVLDAAGTTAFIVDTASSTIDVLDVTNFAITQRIPLPETIPTTYPDPLYDYVRVGSSLYWWTIPQCPTEDGGPCAPVQNIYTMPIATLTPALLASIPQAGIHMVTDGAYAYFSNQLRGIYRVPLRAGATAMALHVDPASSEFVDLAIDDSYLYFAEEGQILRVAR